MKNTTIILLTTCALVAGCTDPQAVEVTPPPGENPGFELIPIPPADSTIPGTAVDSAGILPSEQLRFPGTIVVGRTTHAASWGVRTTAGSRVLFEDRNRPVQTQNRVFGFWGLDVGPVTLNSAPLLRLPHRVRVQRAGADSLVPAGVEFVRDLTADYRPNTTYTWTAPSPDSVSPFTFSIRTPDALAVVSPAAGQVVSRDRDLMLRWTGAGPIEIVISGFDPLSRRSHPILRIQPRANTGMLPVPARVLRVLPLQRYRQYVFTFVLANRMGPVDVGGYPAAVIVQAADVVNVFVELR